MQAPSPTPPLALRLLVVLAVVAFAPLLIPLSPRLPWRALEVLRILRDHKEAYVAICTTIFILVALAIRALMRLWFNELRPRIAGTYIRTADNYRFPKREIDVLRHIADAQSDDTKKGQYFVGCTLKRIGPVSRDVPYFISEKQRTMHIHVLGQTGSGKSASLLFVLALQDILAGKAVIVIDAKGSAENITVMRNLAALAGRTADLRVFSLTHPEQSHSYNPLWIRPRENRRVVGDPLAVAERVFSVFKAEMQELYYKNLGESFFRALICVLYGIVDEHGASLPFTFRDVLECIQNPDALRWCINRTLDRQAAKNIDLQLQNLGDKAAHSFMGLQNMVQKYCDTPLVNATEPDIVIEDVLERKQIVYFQLPSNYYANLTEDIGKIVLQDIQQAGSRRQIFRDQTNQEPVAIHIDEFSNFATQESARSIVSSLNKLRDSNLQFLLAHQITSDLEAVAPWFMKAIMGNTRTRFVLAQQDDELADKISACLGTHKTFESTVRQTIAELAVAVNTGEASLKYIDTFNLHPNAIKQLADVGQAYAVVGSTYRPLNLGCLPRTLFDAKPTEALAPKREQTGGLNLPALAERLEAEAKAQEKDTRKAKMGGAPCRN
jgi:type IV secretory pathway TraG/TraD family ATPase VirD4